MWQHTFSMDKTNMAYSVFNELHLEGQLCDVIIKVEDVEFNAHKIILCGCSSYFHTLFKRHWHNAEKRVYTIPGTTAEMMRMILDYAYTWKALVTMDNVQQLLVDADQFCITGLVQDCCNFLELQLCPENCIGIYKFADFYSFADLCSKAFLYTLRHFEDVVMVSEEFLEMSLPQLCKLIENDNLNTAREEAVCEAVLRWVAHDPSTRKRSLPELLPKVRMALMNAAYLLNEVKNNPLVKDSEECERIVHRASEVLSRPRLPYNILLASGGWSANNNTIEAYNTRDNRWVMVAQSEKIMYGNGTVYLDGFVYFIGGCRPEGESNDVSKFNPVTRTWHQVGPMHSRRSSLSVAVLDSFIFAMGGSDGNQISINTAERYEPETNQWTLVAPMHERRSNASAAALNGKVYICGGFSGDQFFCSAESYSPITDQWTLIQPMVVTRVDLGVVAYHDLLYAVGGFVGGLRTSRTAEVYNPVDDSWRPIADMHTRRSNLGIAVVDNLLCVVGGSNGQSTIDIEYYDDKTNSWKQGACDMAVSHNSCCVVPGLLNLAEYTVPRDRE